MSAPRFALSAQQQAVVDWVVTGRGSLILIARAGCGKTSTALEGVVRTIVDRRMGCVALMAFNREIADEVGTKLKAMGDDYCNFRNVSAGTVHSFGFRAWRKVAPNVRVDEDKVRKIIATLAADSGDLFLLDNGPIIEKLVSLAKQSAFGVMRRIDDPDNWFTLVDHHGLEDDLTEDADGKPETVRLVAEARNVLVLSLAADREVIDFDDMILAPLVHRAKFWQHDWVIIDEAQDTNPARRALALAVLRRGGRLVAIGDDRQAIYGFTGADADALDLIRKATNARTLPLNVTYRCPRAVVASAHHLVPDLTAHPSAPEGVVRTLPSARVEKAGDVEREVQWFEDERPGPDAFVLCRNTKPLVACAYGMIRAGIGCRIEGRAIGEGIIALAHRWKRVKDLPGLVAKLADYEERETAKWLAREREDRAQEVEDKCGTVRAISERLIAAGTPTLESFDADVRKLFGDSAPGEVHNVVTLSSIHRSKGRERRRVYMLDRKGTLPSKWARQAWQLRQEENLEYVMRTRSAGELVDVVMV